MHESAGEIDRLRALVDVYRLDAVVAAVGVALISVHPRIPRRRSRVGVFELDTEVVGGQRVTSVRPIVVVTRDHSVADRTDRLAIPRRREAPEPGASGDVEQHWLVGGVAGRCVATAADEDLTAVRGSSRRDDLFAVVAAV